MPKNKYKKLYRGWKAGALPPPPNLAELTNIAGMTVVAPPPPNLAELTNIAGMTVVGGGGYQCSKCPPWVPNNTQTYESVSGGVDPDKVEIAQIFKKIQKCWPFLAHFPENSYEEWVRGGVPMFKMSKCPPPPGVPNKWLWSWFYRNIICNRECFTVINLNDPKTNQKEPEPPPHPIPPSPPTHQNRLSFASARPILANQI